MTEVRTLNPVAHPCVLHGYHSPVLWSTHEHHVVPRAWTKALGLPEYRTVALCPTGHDSLHRAMSAALRGVKPPRRVDERTQALIDEALEWASAKEDAVPGVGRWAMFARMSERL